MDIQDSEKTTNDNVPFEQKSDDQSDFIENGEEVKKGPIIENPTNETLVSNEGNSTSEIETEKSTDLDDHADNNVFTSAELENTQVPVKKKSFWNSFFGNLLFFILFSCFVYLSIFVFPTGLQRTVVSISLLKYSKLTNSDEEMADAKLKLNTKIAELNKQLELYIPDKPFIIINTTDNEFTLMNGDNIVRKGKCSTGSLVKLEDDKRGRSYFFQTPKGVRKVLKKKKDPVWTRPDWAYIDDGLPIPSPSDPSRIEEGVLGDYALELGNGYMIHGTLWQRYLGLAVTHGCIRLNDADLEVVFKTMEKGSNVYIY